MPSGFPLYFLIISGLTHLRRAIMGAVLYRFDWREFNLGGVVALRINFLVLVAFLFIFLLLYYASTIDEECAAFRERS